MLCFRAWNGVSPICLLACEQLWFSTASYLRQMICRCNHFRCRLGNLSRSLVDHIREFPSSESQLEYGSRQPSVICLQIAKACGGVCQNFGLHASTCTTGTMLEVVTYASLGMSGLSPLLPRLTGYQSSETYIVLAVDAVR